MGNIGINSRLNTAIRFNTIVSLVVDKVKYSSLKEILEDDLEHTKGIALIILEEICDFNLKDFKAEISEDPLYKSYLFNTCLFPSAEKLKLDITHIPGGEGSDTRNVVWITVTNNDEILDSYSVTEEEEVVLNELVYRSILERAAEVITETVLVTSQVSEGVDADKIGPNWIIKDIEIPDLDVDTRRFYFSSLPRELARDVNFRTNWVKDGGSTLGVYTDDELLFNMLGRRIALQLKNMKYK